MFYKKFTDRFVSKKNNSLIPESTQSFSKQSFSQCGEDCIVDFILTNVLNIKRPNFIDVGAFHPYILSNTNMFQKKGGLGVNIEPNPILYEEFVKERPENINLNIGIDKVGGIKDYYMFKESVLNSFDPNSQYLPNRTLERIVQIELSPLSKIVEEYFASIPIDFLSIDVEGLDLLVIQSLDLKLYRPKVICVETIQEISQNEWSRNSELIRYVEAQGYLLHSSTMINSIFIDKNLISVKLFL
jgi:FkbM family methyltransferase